MSLPYVIAATGEGGQEGGRPTPREQNSGRGREPLLLVEAREVVAVEAAEEAATEDPEGEGWHSSDALAQPESLALDWAAWVDGTGPDEAAAAGEGEPGQC